MKKPFLFAEFCVSDGSAASQRCELSISEPDTTADGDAVCNVQLSPILKTEKKIFGVTGDQAKQLAVAFVKQMLAGKVLTDPKGHKIEIAPAGAARIFN